MGRGLALRCLRGGVEAPGTCGCAAEGGWSPGLGEQGIGAGFQMKVGVVDVGETRREPHHPRALRADEDGGASRPGAARRNLAITGLAIPSLEIDPAFSKQRSNDLQRLFEAANPVIVGIPERMGLGLAPRSLSPAAALVGGTWRRRDRPARGGGHPARSTRSAQPAALVPHRPSPCRGRRVGRPAHAPRLLHQCDTCC